MSNFIPNFDKQELTLSNEFWKVELLLERGNNVTQNQIVDKTIELGEPSEYISSLSIKTINKNNIVKSCLLSGLDGGIYLHTANDEEKSYSVKLIDNILIFSLGFRFLAFDIEKQEIKWSIRPDTAEVFEFYDLQEDFLVRGEHEIHRIDKEGQIKWSYGGRDIWVNIDGEIEVIIETDKILLTDFDNNKYVIDFNGKILEDKPYIRPISKKQKWWKFW